MDPFAFDKDVLRICPSYGKRYQELIADWSPGRPSRFNLLDDLGHHVAQSVNEGRSEELRALFEFVEKFQMESNGELQNDINNGLLQSLQAEVKNLGIDPDLFLEYLGPKTRHWWNDIRENIEGGYDW